MRYSLEQQEEIMLKDIVFDHLQIILEINMVKN